MVVMFLLLTLSAHLSRTLSGTKLHLSCSGHCRPHATILTPFSSSPPWYSSPLILLFPQSSFGFSADSHLSVIPIPLSPHIYRPSSGPPNACPSAGIPVPVLHEPEHRPPLMTKSPSSLF